MSLTPPSSIAPASVTIAGTVDVSDRAARLLGHTNVDNFPADQLVHLAGSLAVTGPLTDAQLRASAVPVDGSGVTQPVSVDALPLPDGAATEASAARAADSLDDVGLTAILEREKIEP